MATAWAHSDQSPPGPHAMDFEGNSNVSSPLSDVGDCDAHDEEIENMQLDDRGLDDDKLSPGGNPPCDTNEGFDSDSVLSDAASDVNSDANATDAETERLFNTPQNQRQRNVVVDKFNNDRVYERNPSRLIKNPTVFAKNLNRQDVSEFDDDKSVADSWAEKAMLPRSPVTNDSAVHEDTRQDMLKRKRKSSPALDHSDSKRPLRKRTGSPVLAEMAVDQYTLINEDDATSANPHSGRPSTGDDDASPVSNRDTTLEAPERRTTSIKSARGISRQKAMCAHDVAVEADSDTRENQADGAAEDEAENHEELDGDAEEETDLTAKNIEEMERKNAAFKDWTHIEQMFSVFRERLYKDRLQQLEDEEQSLMADEPTHPEYLIMKKCIDDRLERRLQEINTEYELRMQAHERRAVAQRAQIWSQFFQAVREKREQALERLNQQWYEIQSARRSAHSLPDYGLLFPKDHTQRLRNAIAYNTEVSTLASLAKYEGFPADPELRGASSSEIEADLNAIEHVRRARRQYGPHQSRDEYRATTFSRLGPAGEQFIKDTPWANPKHSAHKLFPQAPNQLQAVARRVGQLIHVPPPADVRTVLEGQPAANRAMAPTSSQMSGSSELARSLSNQSACPVKRVNTIPQLSRGSKATAA